MYAAEPVEQLAANDDPAVGGHSVPNAQLSLVGHSSAIVAPIREDARQHAAVSRDEDERIAADVRDRVIGRLLRTRLALADVLERGQVDPEVAERIREARNELDRAVAELDDPRFFPVVWARGTARRPPAPDGPDSPGASRR